MTTKRTKKNEKYLKKVINKKSFVWLDRKLTRPLDNDAKQRQRYKVEKNWKKDENQNKKG